MHFIGAQRLGGQNGVENAAAQRVCLRAEGAGQFGALALRSRPAAVFFEIGGRLVCVQFGVAAQKDAAHVFRRRKRRADALRRLARERGKPGEHHVCARQGAAGDDLGQQGELAALVEVTLVEKGEVAAVDEGDIRQFSRERAIRLRADFVEHVGRDAGGAQLSDGLVQARGAARRVFAEQLQFTFCREQSVAHHHHRALFGKRFFAVRAAQKASESGNRRIERGALGARHGALRFQC